MKIVISKHHSLPVDINNLYFPVQIVLLTLFSRKKDALKHIFTNFGFTWGQALNEVMILLSCRGATFISLVTIECWLLLTKIVLVFRGLFHSSSDISAGKNNRFSGIFLPAVYLLPFYFSFIVQNSNRDLGYQRSQSVTLHDYKELCQIFTWCLKNVHSTVILLENWVNYVLSNVKIY